jgi:hypothetical protein
VEAVGIALIGVFGALLGVIATEIARHRREQRASEGRLRASARMVSAELGMAAISLKSAKDTGLWVLLSVPSAGWSAHGAALAAAMDDDAFYVVMEAATKVSAMRTRSEIIEAKLDEFATTLHDPQDDLRRELDQAYDMCRHAQAVLAPFAYPGGDEQVDHMLDEWQPGPSHPGP